MAEIRRLRRGEAGYPLIEVVEPVEFGVVRLVFDDGYEGILDLRSSMTGAIWKNVQTEADFFAIRIDEFGSDIFWGADGLCALPADGCRLECERQAAAIRALGP